MGEVLPREGITEGFPQEGAPGHSTRSGHSRTATVPPRGARAGSPTDPDRVSDGAAESGPHHPPLSLVTHYALAAGGGGGQKARGTINFSLDCSLLPRSPRRERTFFSSVFHKYLRDQGGSCRWQTLVALRGGGGRGETLSRYRTLNDDLAGRARPGTQCQRVRNMSPPHPSPWSWSLLATGHRGHTEASQPRLQTPGGSAASVLGAGRAVSQPGAPTADRQGDTKTSSPDSARTWTSSPVTPSQEADTDGLRPCKHQPP